MVIKRNNDMETVRANVEEAVKCLNKAHAHIKKAYFTSFKVKSGTNNDNRVLTRVRENCSVALGNITGLIEWIDGIQNLILDIEYAEDGQGEYADNPTV